MNTQTISAIEQKMLPYLDNAQMKQLHQTLLTCLEPNDNCNGQEPNDLIKLFLSAKRVEGCSDKTVRYYDSTLRNAFVAIGKEAIHVTTDDLRMYLDKYQNGGTVSKTTIDNIRRILSSFFAWLEDEDYIVKSPVRRIHKVKT